MGLGDWCAGGGEVGKGRSWSRKGVGRWKMVRLRGWRWESGWPEEGLLRFHSVRDRKAGGLGNQRVHHIDGLLRRLR